MCQDPAAIGPLDLEFIFAFGHSSKSAANPCTTIHGAVVHCKVHFCEGKDGTSLCMLLEAASRSNCTKAIIAKVGLLFQRIARLLHVALPSTEEEGL